MTLDEIRKNKPEGATHFMERTNRKIRYYKNIYGWCWYSDDDDDWYCSNVVSFLLTPLY